MKPRIALCFQPIVFGLLVLSSPLTMAADTPSALESSPEGWVDLLAKVGDDLKGWSRGPIPPAPTPLKPASGGQWSIDKKTGYLVCSGEGGHEWVRWDEEMSDAVFHVEWRFTRVEGKKGYNSGVYTRNSADAKVWHQGQTGDASGGYLFGESPAGDKLKFFNTTGQMPKSRVKPAGEWNTFEFTSKGPEITLWVNGAVTTRFDACGQDPGYVGLEAEGYRIEFRNVKLKKLDHKSK